MSDAEADRSPGLQGGARFATTRWSLVLAATAEPRSPRAREALSTLCATYWYPLYAFARRRGIDADAAQDLTQGFFAKLLEKEGLRHAQQGHGRFRSFLLVSFRNYLEDERLRGQARKRGGGQTLLPIDMATAEDRYVREPSHELTPERLFERRWALLLLDRAVSRLAEEYGGSRRRRLFERLKITLTGEADKHLYSRVAREFGMTEVGVRVAVHRLRKRYRAVLIDEIAQTLGSEEEVDAEVRHLLAALETPV